MKICIVRNAQYENNASMHRIVNSLTQKRHEICIISRSREYNNSIHKKISNLKTTINIFEIGLKTKYGKNVLGVFNLLRYNIKIFSHLIRNRKSIEVVHAYDLDTGYVTRLFCSIFNKKFVYHIADFYADSRGKQKSLLNKVVKKIELKVINKSDSTIICTEERKSQISGSKPKALYVIHNTPSIGNLPPLKRTNYPLKITYIGGLSKSRFILELLNTIANLKDYKLVIGGTGPLENEVQHFSEVYSNITYLGKVPYEQSLEKLEQTDLMIAMYNPEGNNHQFAAPNKIYESMALKKPIIVAKKTGLSHLVESYDFGWSIEYNQYSFMKLLRRISDEPKNLIKKSNNATKVYPEYSWDKIKRDIQRIYDDL